MKIWLADRLRVFWVFMSKERSKCIFLDRDGVLNADRPDYVYLPAHYKILPGVPEALQACKQAGYLLIVITNQSGISQGIYSRKEVDHVHGFLQRDCNNLFDKFYFSPYHPTVTESLSRKPDSLLFEKAIAKFIIDPSQSWMIGDRDRDLIPAQSLGIKTIRIGKDDSKEFKSNFIAGSLQDSLRFIIP